MEDDAGAEFRNKIRLLERKLADAIAKVCLCVLFGFTCIILSGRIEGADCVTNVM